jgi:hypothetical protein
MCRSLFLMAVAAVTLTFLAPSKAPAQTVSNVAAASSNSTANANGATTVSTSNAAPFFGGFVPGNLVQTPVNFSGPLQSGVNYAPAMAPQTLSTSVMNVSQAFHNITFPLFRSTAPNTPIISPGPGNPIQPSSIPPFYTARQLKMKGQ